MVESKSAIRDQTHTYSMSRYSAAPQTMLQNLAVQLTKAATSYGQKRFIDSASRKEEEAKLKKQLEEKEQEKIRLENLKRAEEERYKKELEKKERLAKEREEQMALEMKRLEEEKEREMEKERMDLRAKEEKLKEREDRLSVLENRLVIFTSLVWTNCILSFGSL